MIRRSRDEVLGTDRQMYPDVALVRDRYVYPAIAQRAQMILWE